MSFTAKNSMLSAPNDDSNPSTGTFTEPQSLTGTSRGPGPVVVSDTENIEPSARRVFAPRENDIETWFNLYQRTHGSSSTTTQSSPPLLDLLAKMLRMSVLEEKSARMINNHFLAEGKFFTSYFIQCVADTAAALPMTSGAMVSEAEAKTRIMERMMMIFKSILNFHPEGSEENLEGNKMDELKKMLLFLDTVHGK